MRRIRFEDGKELNVNTYKLHRPENFVEAPNTITTIENDEQFKWIRIKE